MRTKFSAIFDLFVELARRLALVISSMVEVRYRAGCVQTAT
jgi:hypothetical protein